MTIEQVRKVLRSQPFRAFVLNLADGRSVGVSHPDFLMVSPTGRTVAVYGLDDAVEVIDLLLVTSLQIGDGLARRQKSG